MLTNINTAVADILKPYMDYLSEFGIITLVLQKKTLFLHLMEFRDLTSHRKNWTEIVYDIPHHFLPPTKGYESITADKSDTSESQMPRLAMASIAVILRLLKKFPTVFRETEEYCRLHDIDPPYFVLGNSTEDFHRAWFLVRAFQTRRQKETYNFANSRNAYNAYTFPMYNPNLNSVPQSLIDDVTIPDRLVLDAEADAIIANAGFDPGKHAKRYAEFQQMSETEKSEHDLAHVEALERFRSQLVDTHNDNEMIRDMPHLNTKERTMILQSMQQCIGKVSICIVLLVFLI